MILHPRGRRSCRQLFAYTLAEVLCAVLVLAIIATAFYAALASGFAVVESARENLRATQILAQKIEAIRLCRWDQFTNCANFTFQDCYDPFDTNSTGIIYTGTITTNAAAAIPDSAAYKSNMRLVTVAITWTTFNGSHSMAHSRQMQTYVARYGLQNYIWGAAKP